MTRKQRRLVLIGGSLGVLALAVVLVLSALLTLAGPWVEHVLPGMHAWLPFDCGVR